MKIAFKQNHQILTAGKQMNPQFLNTCQELKECGCVVFSIRTCVERYKDCFSRSIIFSVSFS